MTMASVAIGWQVYSVRENPLDLGLVGLAEFLPDETLREDDSAALVAAGLTALAAGDAAGATSAYERLVERWRGIQLLERSN